MHGAILKATNCSFQKGMTFCRSICVKKTRRLLAFIFEQPSYLYKEIKFKRNLISKDANLVFYLSAHQVDLLFKLANMT